MGWLTTVLVSWLTPAIAQSAEPILINQIAVTANPDVVYAAGRPIGVLKSVDRGRTWAPARRGLANTSVYHLVVHPTDQDVLYIGTFGGGVYRSDDGARTWIPVNTGLGNTNIHALAIDPSDPRRLVASTSTGDVFHTLDEGGSWAFFGEGLPAYDGEVLASFLFDGSRLYLGQGGVFEREAAWTGWRPVGAASDLASKAVSALALDAEGILLAGTRYGGLYRRSAVDGWVAVGTEFRRDWIRTVLPDGRRSDGLMIVSVLGRGLFTVTPAFSWRALTAGLPTEDDIETIVRDVRRPERLYLGTHRYGLYVSDDGGRSWRTPSHIVYESAAAVIASLDREQRPTAGAADAIPPPVFSKCNQCHGWTDPVLNQKPTYWRVAANRRNWTPTVARMAQGAGLTLAEQRQVVNFLDRYTHPSVEIP